MPDLFRREAVDHATRRLTGDVLLATPVTLRIYTLLAVGVVIAVIVFLTRSSYAREETVIGWLVPKGGIIRVAARQGGTVERLLVGENDIVRPRPADRAAQPVHNADRWRGCRRRHRGRARIRGGARAAEAVAMRTKLLAERADLAPKRKDLEDQLAELRRQIGFQQTQVRIAGIDFKRFQILAAGGNLAVRQVDQARAALLSAEQSLSQLRAAAFGAQQQIGDVEARLHAIPADLAAADASARSAGAEVAQKQIAAGTQSLDIVVAAVGGRVLAIRSRPARRWRLARPSRSSRREARGWRPNFTHHRAPSASSVPASRFA